LNDEARGIMKKCALRTANTKKNKKRSKRYAGIGPGIVGFLGLRAVPGKRELLVKVKE